MSYTDDAVKAKLAALNESHDSIVAVAQWIMFHRRHAERTATLWLARLQDNANAAKRLNLIYLANEVVQQSRARSKKDFHVAFEPVIADATITAYKGSNQEVQGKLRRVVEVWRERQIFSTEVLDVLDKKLEEIDKSKGGKGPGEGARRLGGTLFGGGGIAPELEAINKAQTAVAKAETSARSSTSAANAEYAKMTDPKTPVPSAPVRCAKLRGLVKELTAAQTAVESSLKTRNDLISSLENLLSSHRAKLDQESDAASQLTMKINTIEMRAREVEDSIMRGQDHPAEGHLSVTADPTAPEVESFTPPAEELTFTGDHVPESGSGTPLDNLYQNPTGADPIEEQPPNLNEPPPAFQPPPPLAEQQKKAAAQANDFLKDLLAAGGMRQASGELPASATNGSPGDPRLKRRKLGHKASNLDDEMFGVGNVGGIDEEGISAMLGQ